MVKNTGYVPCNQIAIDDPSYLSDFYKANPLFQAATKQVHLMIPWYTVPRPELGACHAGHGR